MRGGISHKSLVPALDRWRQGMNQPRESEQITQHKGHTFTPNAVICLWVFAALVQFGQWRTMLSENCSKTPEIESLCPQVNCNDLKCYRTPQHARGEQCLGVIYGQCDAYLYICLFVQITKLHHHADLMLQAPESDLFSHLFHQKWQVSLWNWVHCRCNKLQSVATAVDGWSLFLLFVTLQSHLLQRLDVHIYRAHSKF